MVNETERIPTAIERIVEMADRASSLAARPETSNPGSTYEQGVMNALHWVLGLKDAPLDLEDP